jgi:hypothetical protein
MSESKVTENSIGDELMNLFYPVILSLEEQVSQVQLSQSLLKNELESLLITINQVKEKLDQDRLIVLLEEKAKKLISIKRRLTLIHTILQNSNERCRKLLILHKISE